MTEEVKKFFEEVGLVKGIENMKKFQEEFIDKNYIEKQKVDELIAVNRSEVYDEMNKALKDYQQKVKEIITSNFNMFAHEVGGVDIESIERFAKAILEELKL